MAQSIGQDRWNSDWASSYDLLHHRGSRSTGVRQVLPWDLSHGSALFTFAALVITTFLLLWHWSRRRRNDNGAGNRVPSSLEDSLASSGSSHGFKDDALTVKPMVSIYVDKLFHPSLSILELQQLALASEKLWHVPFGLTEICKHTKAVLIAKVASDEEEDLVRQFLDCALDIRQRRIPDHRILFSSTDEGRVSIVRQLEPTIHIETVESVVVGLKGKIPNLVLLGSETNQATLEDCATIVKELYLTQQAY